MTNKDKVKASALVLVPTVLGVLGVVYAPGGLTVKVLVAWSFIMGAMLSFALNTVIKK